MHEKMYEKAEEIIEAIKGEIDWRKIEKNLKKLQELGVLPPTMTFGKDEDGKYSLSDNSFANEAELAEGLKTHWINQTAKEYRCEKKLQYIKENVNIGTEFTFHHEAFQFTLDDLEKNKAGRGIDIGKAIIERWTGDLIQTYSYRKKAHGLLITAVNTGNGKKKFKAAGYNAVEIEFHIENPIQCQDIKWKVNFDLDPSCIELQTQPMPYQFFQNYGFCIDELIFNHINKYGLIADQDSDTGGGGHISLDVRTAFGENAVYLRNFLVLYACETKREFFKDSLTEEQKRQLAKSFLTEKQRQILIASKDNVNAPFLFERISEWVPFQNCIAEFDRGPTNISRFVQDMHSSVYINVMDKLESLLGGAGKVTAEDRQHYQAVNLEHIGDQGRIELRRFDAQQSIDELLEQLDALFEILLMARTNWKISIDKALESDYFAG